MDNYTVRNTEAGNSTVLRTSVQALSEKGAVYKFKRIFPERRFISINKGNLSEYRKATFKEVFNSKI